ncbi:MAG: LPS export ABC transporter periplasmic protein LptC [Candidatus Omnitrophica bacterium]|nr:LPS export ABC transporter periplasmic protein LptC [Candidatus Omnitrophota bacterium]
MKYNFLIIWAVIFLIAAPVCQASENADQIIEHFVFTSTDLEGSQGTWVIEGKTAFVNDKDIMITDVEARGRYPDQELTLIARRGALQMPAENVLLEKDIEIHSSRGMALSTDHLFWYAKEGVLSSDAYVRLKKGNVIAEAEGALAKKGFKEITLLERPHIQMVASSLTIVCAGPAHFNEGDNTATFNNDVILVHGDKELSASRMVAYLDETGNDIAKFVATGAVTIKQGKNKAYSERVDYFPRENKILITEKPRLIISSMTQQTPKAEAQ